ncbi:MAG: ABC transporter permease [Verrucomicrobia bacterium]|nr:ABC transporter permease [Verrucomicrobiota bacterium]MBI3868995.1 ABC transporter permease [Verrucomicrobiota bacterium]
MSHISAVASVVILEMIRRKDVYVLLFLTALITLALGAVNFFGDPKIARYLKEVCLALIWVSSLVIAVFTAARQIPSEKESRTLFPLLAKPISRAQVMLGKFLGCWLACAASLAAFYVFFAILSATREGQWPVANYVQAYWLHCLFCGLVASLTLLGSVWFTAVSSNATIILAFVGAMLVLGRHLHKVAMKTGGLAGNLLDVGYYALPHLEWFDVRDLIIHNWPRIDWDVIAKDTLYAFAYGGCFLALACWRFRRYAIH